MFYTFVDLYKSNIYVRGYRNGKRFQFSNKLKPYIFIPTKKNSEWKTVDGKPVEKLQFESVYDAKEFLKKYEDVEGFDVYGFTYKMWVYSYLNDMFPGDVEYDLNLIRKLFIDIEVSSKNGFPSIEEANDEVTAITMFCGDRKIIFGLKDYKPPKGVEYVKCNTEKELLLRFLLEWRRFDPDVITGWNIEGFDIPYLYNRISRVLGQTNANKLSPFDIVEEREVNVKGFMEKRKIKYIYGIKQLDYLELYKKFSFKNVESYALDTIAHLELGERKLDYSEYANLDELYEKDYQKFIDYNLRDVELVKRLDEKLGFIDQAITIAYYGKVNYEDSLTTLRIWDTIVHNNLFKQKIVVPPKKKKERRDIVGGFVKDPSTGLHEWVVSFDLNSLYPHLMMQYNISPECFVTQIESFEKLCRSGMAEKCVDKILDGYVDDEKRKVLIKNNLSMTASGSLFTKNIHGIFPKLMDFFYAERKKYKKLKLEYEQKIADGDDSVKTKNLRTKYHNLQLALKILINSAYGAIANEYFRWYDDRVAESVTVSGQLSIRWVANHVNRFLNEFYGTNDVDYVLGMDTDSMYIKMEKYVKEYIGNKSTKEIVEELDKFCEEKIQPVINDAYEKLYKMMNAYDQKMFMKREKICDKVIWVAKKKYIMNVWNDEGVSYNEPKIKLVGIEAVRSSTPEVCREKIKEAIRIIMTGNNDDLIEFIEEFKKEYEKLSFEDIATPKSIKGLEKYAIGTQYKKGTPIHVKGAVIYNRLVIDKGLEKKYNLIQNGDKIRHCYLKVPNPIHEEVISCPRILPPEFGLDEYIDYDKQFEKTLLSPIKLITEVIGWHVKKQPKTIYDLFG